MNLVTPVTEKECGRPEEERKGEKEEEVGGKVRRKKEEGGSQRGEGEGDDNMVEREEVGRKEDG